MTDQARTRAPEGDLRSFDREHFVHDGIAHDLHRKGREPAVLVIIELPGITPQVLGFADRVVALGCTAVLPDLFGTAGCDLLGAGKFASLRYTLRSNTQVCISREFVVFATGRTSPVVGWLRALAAAEHQRCGGPGVGVVGMCFSGGFALAMAVDPRVLAPVLAEPSLPVPVTKAAGGRSTARRRTSTWWPAAVRGRDCGCWACGLTGTRSCRRSGSRCSSNG